MNSPTIKDSKLSHSSVKPKEPKGGSYFLGIGINSYNNFQKLENAVKDVEDIYSLLTEKYDISERGSMLLLEEMATYKGIVSALDHLKDSLHERDKLIIYFSGHGHLDKWKKGYWIPIDGEKNDSAYFIRNSTLREYLEDIPALHILLISDSCFSGSIFYRGNYRSSSAIEQLEVMKSRWALCSGRHDEVVEDGLPGENSPFAASFIQVLKNNNLPKLKVSTLTNIVVDSTKSRYVQLPEGGYMQGVDHRGGQYIFSLKGVSINYDSDMKERNREFVEVVPFNSALSKMYSQREEVKKWFINMVAYQLIAISLIAILGLFIKSAIGTKLLMVAIPFIFYLAPYLSAYFSELKVKMLLLLSGAYALVYYPILMIWTINSPTYFWWHFILMLGIGIMLYYLIIPLIKKA